VWTTPLRMPVSQPYRKSRVQLIETCLQDIQFMSPDRTDPVNRRKQLQAFPPNFIHSLDASHMLLSALNCDRLGMTFAAVHDSFWTHACDVDGMNRVLRDSFIDIHSEPVVERLAKEFEARYRHALYHARIDDASPAAVMIKAWRKKNLKGASPRDELLLEYKRQKLLRSPNPDDVLAGREMVTPASLFEAFKDQTASGLATEDDLQGTRLGLISEQGSSNDDAESDAMSASQAMGSHQDNDGMVDEPTSSTEPTSGTTTNSADEREAQSAEHMQKVADKALVAAQRGMDRAGKSTFGDKIGRNIKTRHAPAKLYVHVWLPLEFPPVPEKGDFDVARLRESQYFFS
jgi:DNA-directed RNA polymerase